MNKRLISIVKRIIAAVFIFISFTYITVFLCFAPNLFTLDVINNKIKLIGPNQIVLSFINQKFLYLLRFNLGITYDEKQLSGIIMPYVAKSIGLLMLGIILGLILGILKGIADSRRSGRDTSFKLLSSIIPLSLPDILIIAILQYIAIWLNKHGMKIFKVAGAGSVSQLILPVIALSLPCACYLARITALSIDSCYKNEYIKTAIGKGCSPHRILWNHVMRNTIGVVLEGLTNITAMVICNLVIVEYLFSYPGLIMLLVKMQSSFDISSFVSIIFIIGVVYFALDILFNLIRFAMNRPDMEETI